VCVRESEPAIVCVCLRVCACACVCVCVLVGRRTAGLEPANRVSNSQHAHLIRTGARSCLVRSSTANQWGLADAPRALSWRMASATTRSLVWLTIYIEPVQDRVSCGHQQRIGGRTACLELAHGVSDNLVLGLAAQHQRHQNVVSARGGLVCKARRLPTQPCRHKLLGHST
jgi:hypothetical protein